MSSKLTRLAPLTGALFAVITFIAFVTGTETPDANSTPAKVIAFYTAHRSSIETTNVLFLFAFLIALFWAGALYAYLRRSGASESLSALVLAGGVLMLAGAAILAGVEYGLAHDLRYFTPATIQTLNVLANELFLPLVIGGCVFGLAAGIAILQSAALPSWVGWVAIVLGIVAAIPPIGFIGLLVFLLWSLIVSIMIYMRSGEPASVEAVSAPAM